jgi:hypothetical protein
LSQWTLLRIEPQAHWRATVRAIAANHHHEDQDDSEYDDQSRRRDEYRLVDE